MWNTKIEYSRLLYMYSAKEIANFYIVGIGSSDITGGLSLFMSPTVVLSGMSVESFYYRTIIDLDFISYSHGKTDMIHKGRVFETKERAMQFKNRFLRLYGKHIDSYIESQKKQIETLKNNYV